MAKFAEFHFHALGCISSPQSVPDASVDNEEYDGFVAWLSSFGFLLDEKAARGRHGLP
jgi:hypothetical protein